MTYLYYVLCPYDLNVTGPVSFKEAVDIQRRSKIPVIILKEVVDDNGKEVK